MSAPFAIPPVAPSPFPQKFGRYILLGLIGRGGMAEVFRAVPRGIAKGSEVVALKRLLPELTSDAECVDLFTGEADVSRLLRHPHIVNVLEAGEVNDEFYMVMEYVEGRDLGAILSRCRKRHILLPVDFALYIARAVLDALGYVHDLRGPQGARLKVVHSDVSPSNVFVSKDGEIKLGDFGVARIRALERWERSDLVWGKLSYLSPEQLAGSPFDQRADLWSVGSLLYEMLTNRKPFQGKSAKELKTAIRSGSPASIATVRNISVGLEQAIFKALEKDPAKRYQSAQEFSDALGLYFQQDIGTPLGIASVVRGLFGVK